MTASGAWAVVGQDKHGNHHELGVYPSPEEAEEAAGRFAAGKAHGPGPAGLLAVRAMRIVVGGAVLRDGRLLAARRSAPEELAGRWELPGGKVEPEETAPRALVRELREELGVEVRPVERLPGLWPLGRALVLQVWTAELVSGEPRPLQDHDELRWLAPGRLFDVPWLEQDLPAVALVAERLPARMPGADASTAGASAPR